MYETTSRQEQIGALAKGLDTRSPNRICAATYLYSELNGAQQIVDDFTYDAGYGMDSKTIRRWTLPVVFDEMDFKDYSEYEQERLAGEFFSRYEQEELDSLALYRLHDQEGVVPSGMKRKIKELKSSSADIESRLSEMESRLESALDN